MNDKFDTLVLFLLFIIGGFISIPFSLFLIIFLIIGKAIVNFFANYTPSKKKIV